MFKVGDYVMVKDREYLYEHRIQRPGVADEMYEYAGTIQKIKSVNKEYDELVFKKNGYQWLWHMGWVIPVFGDTIDNRKVVE